MVIQRRLLNSFRAFISLTILQSRQSYCVIRQPRITLSLRFYYLDTEDPHCMIVFRCSLQNTVIRQRLVGDWYKF